MRLRLRLRLRLQVQVQLLLLLLLLLLFLLLTCRVPFRSGGQRGEKPRRGGVHGCTPSAAGAGCPFRGSPGWTRTRSALARRARRQGVLSFGYFSLHKQRKVTRRKAKAFLLHLLSLSHLHLLLLRRPMDCRSGLRRDMHDRLRWSRLKPLLQTFSPDIQTSSNSKGFRPFGRVTFLCSRKEKVTKRKRALPCALRAARSGSADAPGIRGRGILPLPRTAHIHVRRPCWGFSPRWPPLRKGIRSIKSRSNINSKGRSNCDCCTRLDHCRVRQQMRCAWWRSLPVDPHGHATRLISATASTVRA